MIPIIEPVNLAAQIKILGVQEFGFDEVRFTQPNVESYAERYQEWIQKKYHGSMSYMANRMPLRLDPTTLLPNVRTIISIRKNYLSDSDNLIEQLHKPDQAYISRYALGRDYHKYLRKKLNAFGKAIETLGCTHTFRPFVDSAPILEKPLAEQAGQGWIGKNTLIINRYAGSWFFLAELFTDLELASDLPVTPHCGSCTQCLKICPTQAIIAPYILDARRCISYLTIENKTSIPIEFRKAIGNRIFGCDDCQIVCPWNRYAQQSPDIEFSTRHQLNNAQLIDLFQWTDEEFNNKTQGMAIRRTGYSGWIRNIAVALGNANPNQKIVEILQKKKLESNELVAEHIEWAIQEQQNKLISNN
ncbi:MAG: tRNA epoxyqueuosine(34) reductase QueG [Pseudomonadota bacterium]